MNRDPHAAAITEPPIVCTLGGREFAARLAWIADLNATAFQHAQRTDLRLELSYATAARDRVLEMVRREQECCAFLTFTVRETPGAVKLTIEAPESARVAAEMVFAPFERQQ